MRCRAAMTTVQPNMPAAISLLLRLFLLLPLSSTAAAAADSWDSSLVYAGCSAATFPAESAAQLDLDSLLSSLANSAALSPYSSFTSSSVSGLYQCGGDLPLPSCAACVRAAIQRLSSLCPSAAAAAAQLRPCLLRYSNDSSFLGRPDTSLAFRRCGPPSPSSAASDRQAALSALSAPPGAPFRSAAAGPYAGGAVRGRHRRRPAVARLTAECGGAGAASGDVYLGKCYARFWPAGEEGAQPSSCAHRRRTRSADMWALFSLVVVVVVVACQRKEREASRKWFPGFELAALGFELWEAEYRYWSLIPVLHRAGTDTLQAARLTEIRVTRVYLPIWSLVEERSPTLEYPVGLISPKWMDDYACLSLCSFAYAYEGRSLQAGTPKGSFLEGKMLTTTGPLGGASRTTFVRDRGKGVDCV
ncbi:Cysteine-rich repeat secretory protein 12 [Ananas comosus]|uniref:Cysteine-rich repeat secretory protein 12 n=1 Tax=Ananas comosus TaxID=4615 RepID=A0A199V200_ANACO|nr:Cysteine-rich repeat secretory protein 12 [Ananas comosus]